MTGIDKSSVALMLEMASKASGITVVTHTRPDGDAMGSSLGLLRFLTATGKDAVIVLNDRYPDSLSFMAGEDAGSILVYEDEPEKTAGTVRKSDLVFCLDMNSFGRAEKLEGLLREKDCPKILIDHHLNPDTGSFDLVFSKTDISSTSELLYHILMATPETGGDARRLPVKCAEALLTGMTTDTNNFSNSVFPSTFEMASDLLGAGIDRNAIVAALYCNYRENRYRLTGRLLYENMVITAEGVAYMILDKAMAAEYDIREGETEGIVNIPLGIKNVRMSILLKEDEDRFRVSVRSKEGVSANRCASMYFNGGGHELAAGGKLFKGKDIPDGTVREAAEYVETRTREFLGGK